MLGHLDRMTAPSVALRYRTGDACFNAEALEVPFAHRADSTTGQPGGGRLSVAADLLEEQAPKKMRT